MEIDYIPLAIMYAGVVCALTAAYLNKRKSAKENDNDEVRIHIFKTARSISWYATIATLYIMFTLYGIGIDLGVPPTVGIIMLVQLGTWGISAPVLSYYYSVEKIPNMNLITGLLIILVSTVFFIFMAIFSMNWFFLFCPIPLGIIGWYFIKQSNTGEEGGS